MQLRIAVSDGVNDPGVMDADAINLLHQIKQLDVEASLVAEEAPDGAKSFGGVDIGALLVAVGGGLVTVRNLAGLLTDFLHSRTSRTVTIQVGGKIYQATGVSRADQRQALEDFLLRFGGGRESSDLPATR
jgi:hypothetical protein